MTQETFMTRPYASLAALCAAAFLLLQANGAAAQTPERRAIVVNGTGMSSTAPDRAQLSAGVVTQGKTAASALTANNSEMEKVFATLKSLGIPENRIQTSDFSVSPQYAPFQPNLPQPQEQKIIGYQVSNQVVVMVDDLSKLGGALDALVRSGANQAGGVSFTIANPKPVAEKSRRDAVADAMAKAKTLAEAAGVSLGAVLSIEESSGYTPGPRPMMFEAAKMSSVPVAAGETGITVNVTMTYAIQ